MRRTRFDPAALSGAEKTEWNALLVRAARARDAAIEEFERTGRVASFDRDVYGSFKSFLLKHVFYGQCAYCESRITHISYGDAEHYRPKAAVKTLNGRGKEARVRVGTRAHPGYYWLAYDWRNLLPACQRCNSSGKRNFFPVAGTYVTRPPIDLDAEEAIDGLNAMELPLLLNPFFDNPADHLVFGCRGVISGRPGSNKGDTSIKVLGLDRDDLRAERQRGQQLAWRRALRILDDDEAEVREIAERLKRLLMALEVGDEPYSQAASQFVRERLSVSGLL
jgi:hypothetical protein